MCNKKRKENMANNVTMIEKSKSAKINKPIFSVTVNNVPVYFFNTREKARWVRKVLVAQQESGDEMIPSSISVARLVAS